MEAQSRPRDGIRLNPKDVPRQGVYLDLEHDSQTLVVAFAGLKGFLGGVPAFEFRNILSSVAVKSVFIRDHYSAWYHRGVVDVGPDIASVAERLRQIVRKSGAKRVVTVGNSAGGYASLLFGALLDCEAVAFSPQTVTGIELLHRFGDHRWDEEAEALDRSGHLDPRYADLAPALAASSGRFDVYYGAHDEIDLHHVNHIAQLDDVVLHRLENADHRVIKALRDSGWLRLFLVGMASAEGGHPAIDQHATRS